MKIFKHSTSFFTAPAIAAPYKKDTSTATRRIYLLTLAFVLLLSNSYGQQAFNTSGGSGTATNFKLDWSVGETMLVQTAQKNNLTFTQGLLQYNIIVLTTAGTIEAEELKLLPNPTPGILYLQAGFLEKGKMSIQVFNSTGQQMLTRQEDITGFTTKSVNMEAYTSGTYLLQVYWQPVGGYVRKRTYKIIRL